MNKIITNLETTNNIYISTILYELITYPIEIGSTIIINDITLKVVGVKHFSEYSITLYLERLV